MPQTMRRIFQLFLLSMTACAVASAQHAMDTVSTGTMSLATNSQIASAMRDQGIYIGFWNANVTGTQSSGGMKVVTGAFDESTGLGELSCVGDLQFNTGSLQLDLRNLVFVNAAGSQVVTAAVFLDGAYQGRQVVFNITNGSPFGAVAKGNVQGISYYGYAPAFVQEFVNFFQVPQLASTLNSSPVGYLNFQLTLVKAPLSRT